MILIETPRLILRDHISEDLQPLHATLSDPAVVWYLPAMRMQDLEQTKAYLISSMRDIDAAPRMRYNFAVTDRDGLYLGEIGLHYIDGTPDDAHCGLGYFMRPEYWNRDYATEAAGAAARFIFENGASRLSASCLAENLASRRVLEKCGFTQEGLLKNHTWHEGEWKDCAVYRLLKDEFIGRKRLVP